MSDPVRVRLTWQEVLRRQERVAACERLQNPRPLVWVFADSPFYCRLAGIPLEETHRHPDAMVRAQLLGWARILEVVRCDVPGLSVTLDFGSFLTASAYGCELVAQPNSWPAFKPWFCNAHDLLRLERTNPCRTGLAPVMEIFYDRIREGATRFPVVYADGHVDFPAARLRLNTWSEGPFSILCMIAGMDQVSLWCYDRPHLVHRALEIITAAEIERLCHAFRRMGHPPDRIGLADDWAPFLAPDMYEAFALPYEKRIREAFDCPLEFHSCLAPRPLVRRWRDELRPTVLNGFKPPHGFTGLRETCTIVAEVFANAIVLEPDLDGANVMTATRLELAQAARVVCEVFHPGLGLKVCATLSGAHPTDDLEKLNAVHEAVYS